MTIMPRRSALYMPGSNQRALEKAKGLNADALILDLEDSVAPEAKTQARQNISEVLRAGGYIGREAVVRLNGADSQWFADDVAAIAKLEISGVLVPKVESAETVARVREELEFRGAPKQVAIWAMIETPMAIVKLPEIAGAAAGPGNAYPLTCFVIGTNDLVKETRAEIDASRLSALYWLSATVTAARAYGIEVLDSVYNAHKDLDGFERECLQGRQLGMDGKSLIHPAQIEIANRVFAPDVEEVAWARIVLAAFDDPSNAGRGVISIDGKMVELLHAEMARRIVAIADTIEKRERVVAS